MVKKSREAERKRDAERWTCRVVGRKRRKTENQRMSMRIERDSKAERQRGVKEDREKTVGEAQIRCSEMADEVLGRHSRIPHPKRILDCACA